ncbi:MAG: ABC transporter permease subunit [Acidobacteriota bacterium]
MIWTIAAKELRENLISLRFLFLLILALLFIPAAIYSNYQTYLSRLADQAQIEARNRSHLEQLTPAAIFTTPDLSIDVYWPPSLTSLFALGVTAQHPRHLAVSKNRIEPGSPLEMHTLWGLFGGIDYLYLVEFIFSLTACLMSFDAVTRERERGTLKSILANRVSRATFATGKLLGGLTTLLLPLIIAFLAGLGALALGGLDWTQPQFLARASLILVASLVYAAVFYLLGILVSSLVRSTSTSLIISLTVWLVAVLVIPRAATLVARLSDPVKSRQVVWLEKLSAEDQLERDKGRALEALLAQSLDPSDYQKARQSVVQPYEARLSRRLQAIDDDYRRQLAGQRNLSLYLARLSPAGALVSFVTEMTNSGVTAEDRFQSSAEQYHAVLWTELFDKVFRDSTPGGRVMMGMNGAIDPSHLPRFSMREPSLPESFRTADFSILLLWLGATILMTYLALERYDVR